MIEDLQGATRPQRNDTLPQMGQWSGDGMGKTH